MGNKEGKETLVEKFKDSKKCVSLFKKYDTDKSQYLELKEIMHVLDEILESTAKEDSMKQVHFTALLGDLLSFCSHFAPSRLSLILPFHYLILFYTEIHT